MIASLLDPFGAENCKQSLPRSHGNGYGMNTDLLNHAEHGLEWNERIEPGQ